MSVLSSGSAAFDKALGGGFPCGRVIELFGPELSGKTTLCLHTVAAAQRKGVRAAWIDVGLMFPMSIIGATGVDLHDLQLEQPDTLEEALYGLNKLATRAP